MTDSVDVDASELPRADFPAAVTATGDAASATRTASRVALRTSLIAGVIAGVPTLVLASHQDPIHPFAYGQVLARAIPGAAFAEITSKSVDREQYARDVQRELAAFIARLPAASA